MSQGTVLWVDMSRPAVLERPTLDSTCGWGRLTIFRLLSSLMPLISMELGLVIELQGVVQRMHSGMDVE